MQTRIDDQASDARIKEIRRGLQGHPGEGGIHKPASQTGFAEGSNQRGSTGAHDSTAWAAGAASHASSNTLHAEIGQGRGLPYEDGIHGGLSNTSGKSFSQDNAQDNTQGSANSLDGGVYSASHAGQPGQIGQESLADSLANSATSGSDAGFAATESIFSKILASISQLKDISVQHIASMIKSGMAANLSEMAAAKQVLEHTSSVGRGLEGLESIVSSYILGASPTASQLSTFRGNQFDSLHNTAQPYPSLYHTAEPYLSSDAIAAYQSDVLWDSPLGRRILDDISRIKRAIPRTDLKRLKEGTSISDIYSELKDGLKTIEGRMLKLGVKADDPVAKALSMIKDNVKAQEQLNKNQMCFQIPIIYNQKPSSLNVFIFDKKKTGKGAGAEGDLSVALNLETESLGPVDISIRVSDWSVNGGKQKAQLPTKRVDLEITVKDRAVKKYFESIKKDLGNRINEAGFKPGTIECETKSENLTKVGFPHHQATVEKQTDRAGQNAQSVLGVHRGQGEQGRTKMRNGLGGLLGKAHSNSNNSISGVDLRI